MNHEKVFFFALLLLLMASLYGCATSKSCAASIPSCIEIVPPEIQLTGEKTVIERQMVGDYRELERDAWMVSSAKTNVSKSKGSPLAGGDEALFTAMKVREFNADKIRGYKNEGAIGESANGLVAYIQNQRYEASPSLKALLLRVIEDENAARNRIFERSLTKSSKEKATDEQIQVFGKKFAQEQVALAIKNDWIQEKSGQWVRKK
jgi:hypothetical protein